MAHLTTPGLRLAASICLLFVLAAGCSVPGPTAGASTPGYLNAQYVIAGEPVSLVDGVAETPIPGSAARVVTRYFGNDLRHDVDGDGRQEVVFLLTHDTGGSGTWYYVVAALDRPGGWVGSHAMLLGDRIAPKSIEAGAGTRVIVNFADRAPGEPYAASPTQGRSLRLRFDPGTLNFRVIAED